MNFNSLKKSIIPDGIKIFSKDTVKIWGMTAAVPFIRFIIDPKEERKHFKRDCINFMGGTAVFFTGAILSRKILNKTNIKPFKNLAKDAKESMTTWGGLFSWLAFTTLGTVKLNEKFNKQKEKNEEVKSIRKLDIMEGLGKPVIENTVSTSFNVTPPSSGNPYYQYNIDRHSQCSINKPLWRKPL